MRYSANLTSRECIKAECQCKKCPFNGIAGMCIGCGECAEHKILAPVTNCNIIKRGDWDGFCAVALDDSYMVSIPMGTGDVSEYYWITKEEFDTFEQWKNNELKIIEIENRENI